jgi:hypothetical protein
LEHYLICDAIFRIRVASCKLEPDAFIIGLINQGIILKRQLRGILRTPEGIFNSLMQFIKTIFYSFEIIQGALNPVYDLIFIITLFNADLISCQLDSVNKLRKIFI